MRILEHVRRLLAYDAWANRETLPSLASLAAAGPVPWRPLRLMAHVCAAERLWLGRLEKNRSASPVWPELDLEQCRAEAAALPQHWKLYLDRLAPDGLAEPVAYINTKGEPWTSAVGDILMHVVLHSAYHRGQIAAELRAAGATPAVTDFIHCVRQGFLPAVPGGSRSSVAGPKVRVFFYGSFINRRVLAAGGFQPSQIEVARLSGFDIRIEPLANLVRSDRHSVYGILCEATHAELERLYTQEWVGSYWPEAVVVESARDGLVPALCYIAPAPEPAPAAGDYLDRIAGPAREYGFPDWYVERIESFRQR